jgi:hypothetical protein
VLKHAKRQISQRIQTHFSKFILKWKFPNKYSNCKIVVYTLLLSGVSFPHRAPECSIVEGGWEKLDEDINHPNMGKYQLKQKYQTH